MGMCIVIAVSLVLSLWQAISDYDGDNGWTVLIKVAIDLIGIWLS